MNPARTGVDRAFRYVSAEEALDRVDLATAIRVVRTAFRARENREYENPARLALGEGQLLVMTARARADGDAIVKALRINVRDRPPSSWQPAIDGLVLWLGSDSQPMLVADAGAITALRTAAVTAVATELLARPDARRLALLGAGRQGREQVRAITLVRSIERITIWNRTRQRAQALAADLGSALPGIAVELADDPDRAVRDADVVCCATAATTPLFDADAVPSHAHINAIGSYRPDMRELPQELFGRASLVAVDDRVACQAEAGELLNAVDAGRLAPSQLRELSQLIVDPPHRTGITIFKSVGVATADLAVTRALADSYAGSSTTDLERRLSPQPDAPRESGASP